MRVAIVGGGIAGMSAAWELQKVGIDYTLIESAPRLGGKLQSEIVEGFGDKPFVVEIGPDALLTRKPWALQLVHELGVDEYISPVQRNRHSIYILSGGRPVPMPEGLQLLVPTNIGAFLRSPLFSAWGKARILMDWFIPPRRDEGDESLAQFVRRRLGSEALDKLADPLLAGVYNAEAERQSIWATFPQFPTLEREYGSLIRGMKAIQKLPTDNGDDTPTMISFRGGIQMLVDALAARLTGDVRLNTRVSNLYRTSDSYQLTLSDHRNTLICAVILATPANAAVSILGDVCSEAAQGLASIRFAGVGSISLGFRREDIPHPLDAMGLVIPRSEKRRIDGITWSSSKWDHAAPSGYALLRVFFGGTHTRQMLDLDDVDLLTTVREELRSILNITAEPLFYRAYRWRNGYPQYDVGHQGRIAAIENALPPGVYLAGYSYQGVGVPDTIHMAQQAAQKAIERPQKSRSEKWTTTYAT